MRIYADTSFLVSLLCATEKSHAAARAFFVAHPGAEWVTSLWSQFETVNTLRQLCLASGGPKAEEVEAVRRLFKHWHTRGTFQLAETDLAEALTECQQLSAAAGNTQRMRSADVLHVALLEQITPSLFVTRDKDQHALAARRAFVSRLLP